MRWFLQSGGRLLIFFSLAVSSAVAQGNSQPTSDPQQRGWEIFLEARQAAGAGDSDASIHDYSFEAHTRTRTPHGDIELRSKVYYLQPGLVRQEIDAPNGQVVMIYDGEQMWQVRPDGNRYLSPQRVERYREELARTLILFDAPPEPGSVWFVGQQDVEGRPTDVIELRKVRGPSLRLFVDAETRDVVKKTFVGETTRGLARVEEFYSDFKLVSGYRWPHRKRVIRDGKPTLESRNLNLEINTGLQKSDILR